MDTIKCVLKVVSTLLILWIFSELWLVSDIHAQTVSPPYDLPTFSLPWDKSLNGSIHFNGGPHAYGFVDYPAALSILIPAGMGSGLDFGIKDTNFKVLAMATGTVVEADPNCSYGGFGCVIAIRHLTGQTVMLYAHLQPGSFQVTEGQKIFRGDWIANAGNSGMDNGPIHLHVELRDGNQDCTVSERYCIKHKNEIKWGNPIDWGDILTPVDGYIFSSIYVDGEGVEEYNYDGSAVRGEVSISSNFKFKDYDGSMRKNAVARVDVGFECSQNPTVPCDVNSDRNAATGTQFAGGGSFHDAVSAAFVSENYGGMLNSSNTQNVVLTPTPVVVSPTANPSDFSGISFYREKNFGHLIKKLGYGLFELTDDFLSVQMDRSDMHFVIFDTVGRLECFDYNRFGGRAEHPSFNDFGDWWHTTVRVSVEYGSCPQSNQPAKKITLYRQKNFVDQVVQKEVGWEGDFTDNFLSVRLDEGVSFYVRDERGNYRCFDLGDFDGRNESATFGDHGDWWQNIVWMRVQGHLCEPHDVHMVNPVKNSAVPYNTDVTVQFNVPYNTISVYGELHGLSEVWFYHQSASITAWHLGKLSPGNYTVWLRAVNDNGSSNWTENKFSVQVPTCENFSQVGGIGLFEHANCSGLWANITEPGTYLLGALAQQVSTVIVQPGWSVEVRQNQTTSEGAADCISQTRRDLSQWKYYQSGVAMNDNSLVVQVFNVPNCGRQTRPAFCHELGDETTVTLFDYTYCGGRDLRLTAGVYELSEYGYDNMTTAILVPIGKSVRVYSGSGLTGDFVCWNESKWYLYVDSFWGISATADNIIKSIEVFDESNCGGLLTPEVYLYLPPQTIDTDTEVTVVWTDVKAQSYSLKLQKDGVEIWAEANVSPHITSWNLGKLKTGAYSLIVSANAFGQTTQSVALQFTVYNPVENRCVNYTVTVAAFFTDWKCLGSEFRLDEVKAVANVDSPYNDTFSSVLLAEGYSMKVYANANFRGPELCINTSIEDFYYTGMTFSDGVTVLSDAISSFKVYHNTNCSVQPIAPTLLSPANGTELQQNQMVEFKWEGGVADSHIYNIRSTTTEAVDSMGASDNHFVLFTQRPGQYEWYVTSVIGDNQAESERWSFTIKESSQPSPPENRLYLPMVRK